MRCAANACAAGPKATNHYAGRRWGGRPGKREAHADAPLDPIRQVPLDVPVWCVHGTDDSNVPISQSQDYVAAAVGAGAVAELVTIEGGDHFVVIDPSSPAWAQTVTILDTIA